MDTLFQGQYKCEINGVFQTCLFPVYIICEIAIYVLLMSKIIYCKPRFRYVESFIIDQISKIKYVIVYYVIVYVRKQSGIVLVIFLM